MLGSRSNESPSATGNTPTSEQGSGGQGSADAPADGNGDAQATKPSAEGIAPSSAPGGSGADADADSMPSVIGMVLQDAQDLLQARGSYLMDQVDATGDGRFQFFDSNWKVCAQEPEAGAPLASTDVVTLATVKLDESCP